MRFGLTYGPASSVAVEAPRSIGQERLLAVLIVVGGSARAATHGRQPSIGGEPRRGVRGGGKGRIEGGAQRRDGDDFETVDGGRPSASRRARHDGPSEPETSRLA